VKNALKIFFSRWNIFWFFCILFFRLPIKFNLMLLPCAFCTLFVIPPPSRFTCLFLHACSFIQPYPSFNALNHLPTSIYRCLVHGPPRSTRSGFHGPRLLVGRPHTPSCIKLLTSNAQPLPSLESPLIIRSFNHPALRTICTYRWISAPAYYLRVVLSFLVIF